MMDLNATLIFVQVVKVGSFTEAARVLGLPVSTVSDRVASLEKSLGATLLTRSTRKLKLTEMGAEFYRKSELAIGSLQTATDDILRTQHVPSGTLKISGPTDFAAFEIAGAIAEYKRKFPEVQVEAHFSNRYVDMIEEGYDIAIRGGHLEDSTLRAKRIGGGVMFLISSPKYLKDSEPLKQPKDLLRHRCIRFLPSERDGSDASWNLRTADGKTSKVKPAFGIASTSFSLIMELVKAGEGIALVPGVLIKDDFHKKKIVQVLPEWTTGVMPAHLVYPAQKHLSPKVKEMLPILERALRDLMAKETC